MDFSAIKDLYIGSTPVQSAWLNGSKVWGRKPAVDEQSIRDAMILWYDIRRQGATNEGMAATPVLRDLSGNGHDATCYNFAWSGMSGIGGYGFPNLDTWIKNTIVETEIINENKVKIISGGNIKAGIRKPYSKHSIGKFRFTEITSTIYVYQSWGSISNTVLQTINEDGEYTFELEYNEDASYNQLFFAGLGTIEQLPLYPNALVSDGVDDYAQVTGLPILTREKGYTVIAKRDYVDLEGLVYNSVFIDKTGFEIETYLWRETAKFYTYSFGERNILDGFTNELVVQTSKKYGQTDISTGTLADGSILNIFKGVSSSWHGRIALYSLLLFNRDLTPEEIEWVKTNLIETEQ